MPYKLGKWSKETNRLTKIDFSTLSRPPIDLKLNASCSDGFSTQFWPPNSIFDFSGFWDTPTCRSRFEIWWIFMKILVFRTSFVRIWATEFVKIMIFSKKWFSGVYLHLMYPYIKKKVDREPTFRFLRGWLMKKFEKKWIFRCPPPPKKSMTFRGVFDQIGSDIFLANFFAKIHFWVRIVSRGKKCCWTRCDNFFFDRRPGNCSKVDFSEGLGFLHRVKYIGFEKVPYKDWCFSIKWGLPKKKKRLNLLARYLKKCWSDFSKTYQKWIFGTFYL